MKKAKFLPLFKKKHVCSWFSKSVQKIAAKQILTAVPSAPSLS
jgi:hypothetical protein